MKTEKVFVAGKDRTIKFPVMALIKLKNEAGISLNDLQDQEVMTDIETIISLIWAGLATDDPTLTREYLAENMEINELNDVVQKVMSVINESGKKD